MAKLIEREASEINYTPTFKEIEAGVHEFAQYGALNYVYSLTGGNPLHEEAFYNLAWSTVFMYRKISLHNRIYSDRLAGRNISINDSEHDNLPSN